MKILHVIASMNPSAGGLCQGLRNSIPEMSQNGSRNEVVCMDDPASAFIGTDSFPVHAIGTGKGPWHYNNNLSPWLTNNLDRFDTVIVHGLWLYHSYAVRKALNKINAKQRTNNQNKTKTPRLFIMPHGMLDPYFQKAKGRKLKAIRNWIYWKLIEGNVVNCADGVLFTCETELLLARENFVPYRPKKETNVGFGVIAPPAYTPAMQIAFIEQCPEMGNQPYILFLSRIHEKKGVDLLLKAYAEIDRKMTKANTALSSPNSISKRDDIGFESLQSSLPKIVIAGPGMDTSYGKYLKKIVANSEELKNSIFFPGMLRGDAKWGAFYGCDAFILPSHQENFGIAIVEALACNKPVLISNQINIWKEIKTGEGGFVEPDTLEGTKQLLESWLGLSENKKVEMNKAAGTTFNQYFHITPAANRLKQALEI